MKDGDELIGQILKKDTDTIFIRMRNVNINIATSKIKSIKDYDYQGKFKWSNWHDSRYFTSSSGIPLEKKKFYYRTTFLVMHSVQYGITKNVSVDAGVQLLTTLLRASLPYWSINMMGGEASFDSGWLVTPKVGFKVAKNIHIGGGLLIEGDIRDLTRVSGYGILTLGSSDTNLSLVLGHDVYTIYGLEGGFVSLSGTHRIVNNLVLLSENHLSFSTRFFNYNTSTLQGLHGIRILLKKHAIDIGVHIWIDSLLPSENQEVAQFIPNISYGVSF